MKKFAIRLDEETRQALDNRATVLGLPAASTARMLLREALGLTGQRGQVTPLIPTMIEGPPSKQVPVVVSQPVTQTAPTTPPKPKAAATNGADTPCPPHTWNVPSVGDEEVTCRECGYSLHLATQMSGPKFRGMTSSMYRRFPALNFTEALRAAVRFARERENRAPLNGV